MQKKPFRYFAILAEMRTGSNFLEENINQFSDLCSYGEVFNPHFIGGAKQDSLLGVSLADRDDNPERLIDKMVAQDPAITPGFRFFNDHDPRILARLLDDEACGKVILTRNPLDSNVSRKIAAATGQWRLTNLKHQKTAQIVYDHTEFQDYLRATQSFQLLLLNALQSRGQTAFYISYDDLHSIDVVNGLARFLGSSETAQHIDKKLKKQNPAALEDKVANFQDMEKSLGEIDFLNLNRTPNFEPRRGAGVPGFVASSKVDLLYLPIAGTPVEAMRNWIAALEDGDVDEQETGFNQKSLRAWRDAHPGFLAISLVSHPLTRLHRVFCSHILRDDARGFSDQRKLILQKFPIEVPSSADGSLDKSAHRAAFLAFLKFTKASLAQQTGLKIQPDWASQAAILSAASEVQMPGLVLHEDHAKPALEHIAARFGLACPDPAVSTDTGLAEIYDARIEALARDVYQRDYQHFGFKDWLPI